MKKIKTKKKMQDIETAWRINQGGKTARKSRKGKEEERMGENDRKREKKKKTQTKSK